MSVKYFSTMERINAKMLENLIIDDAYL